MIATEAMSFFVEQGVTVSETRSSMSLIKEVDGVAAKAEHLEGRRFWYGNTVSYAGRNLRHRNTRPCRSS